MKTTNASPISPPAGIMMTHTATQTKPRPLEWLVPDYAATTFTKRVVDRPYMRRPARGDTQ